MRPPFSKFMLVFVVLYVCMFVVEESSLDAVQFRVSVDTCLPELSAQGAHLVMGLHESVKSLITPYHR